MGGLNHAEKFKHLGVAKATTYTAPPEAFKIPPPGHYYYDPSSPTMAPEWMVQNMLEFGADGSVIEVLMDGDEMLVKKGRTRVLACLAVNEIRAEKGLPPLVLTYKLADKAKTPRQHRDEMLIENNHRRDRNPVGVAQEIAEMPPGTPPARVAFLLRIDEEDVPVFAKINGLDDQIKAAMRDGKLDWRLAPMLSDLSHANQRAKHDAMIAAGATRGPKARAVIKGKPTARNKAKRPSEKALGRVEERLKAISQHTNTDLHVISDERGTWKFTDFVRAGVALARGDTGPLRELVVESDADDLAAALAPQKPGRKAGK